jgi:hypothetical protein
VIREASNAGCFPFMRSRTTIHASRAGLRDRSVRLEHAFASPAITLRKTVHFHTGVSGQFRRRLESAVEVLFRCPERGKRSRWRVARPFTPPFPILRTHRQRDRRTTVETN